MPELSNIQTFQKLEGSNYVPSLQYFSSVLQRIDLWNDEIKTAFEAFEWKVEADGNVYSTIMELGYYSSRLSKIRIRPSVKVYTFAVDASFKDNWISCDLLMHTEDLRSLSDGKYNSHTYDLVRVLSREMLRNFKDSGIYFTSEAQDGDDFEGIRTNAKSKLWHFDYGLIPSAIENVYSNKPITHQTKRHNDFFEAWNINQWNERLWGPSGDSTTK